eukprot:TRINITY_DN1799_c0_g1_i1.p1 TRINITY_DN1799_c0_g1~~TRINITY_DN1799_c0_g1_i1.p1  ORF type:complete len:409 (-),score=77.06 TRINITY_DN1799_c0_g1_i1:9-1235(-)
MLVAMALRVCNGGRGRGGRVFVIFLVLLVLCALCRGEAGDRRGVNGATRGFFTGRGDKRASSEARDNFDADAGSEENVGSVHIVRNGGMGVRERGGGGATREEVASDASAEHVTDDASATRSRKDTRPGDGSANGMGASEFRRTGGVPAGEGTRSGAVFGQRSNPWDALEQCNVGMRAGVKCKMHVEDVHPTQFAFSPSEVMKKRELHEELYDQGESHRRMQRLVPLVLGPEGFYITDRHHFSKSLLHSDLPLDEKLIACEVIANWMSTDSEEFWRLMYEHSFVWLFDNNGLGPMHPLFLPSSLRHLQPDPFRTLAYFLRINGVFNDNAFYTEFKWGQYLRQFIALPSDPVSPEWRDWCAMQPASERCLPRDWDELQWVKAVFDEAAGYARLPQASHLPGYIATEEGR